MTQTNEAFYKACSEILGIAHEYKVPVKRRTRWNTRFLGNGRYPNFGLIRCFGPLVIMTTRKGTLEFESHDKALDYLRKLKI
jgi:hypothetical protein